MEKLSAAPLKERPLSASINKERWVSIYIRIDDYKKFTYQFLIPFGNELKKREVTSTFHYRMANDFWTGLTLETVVQLSCMVSQYNLDTYLKPELFHGLNEYFDDAFIEETGISKIDGTLLEKKEGLPGLDVKTIRIIAMEEYQVDDITLFIGKFGKETLYDLYVVSSRLILQELASGEAKWTDEYASEKSITMNYVVLHSFFKNYSDMSRFLSWVVYKTLMSIHRVKEVDDLYEWKFRLMKESDQYFQEQKEAFTGISRYLQDCLDNGDEFEDNDLNNWVYAVHHCQKRMTEIADKKLWPTLPFPHIHDMSLFTDIEERTYRNWNAVFNIMKNTNSLLGIGFHLELSLFCAMKNSLQLLAKEGE